MKKQCSMWNTDFRASWPLHNNTTPGKTACEYLKEAPAITSHTHRLWSDMGKHSKADSCPSCKPPRVNLRVLNGSQIWIVKLMSGLTSGSIAEKHLSVTLCLPITKVPSYKLIKNQDIVQLFVFSVSYLLILSEKPFPAPLHSFCSCQ